MSTDSQGLDEVMRRAMLGVAGELQTEIAETVPEQITEADLRGALRRAIQAQLGPGARVEVPMPATESWAGRLGALDLAVSNQLACEVKWCRAPDKLGEVLWDALKLAAVSAHSDGETAVYLVYAAPQAHWNSLIHQPVELLADGDHDVAHLLDTFAGIWRMWRPTGPLSPRVTRAHRMLTTCLVGATPIHTPSGRDWELRCVRLTPYGEFLQFDPTGVPVSESATAAAAARALRFVDTDADVQIDPATLPENRALIETLDALECRRYDAEGPT